jgi:ketosteroid isomerase-like protein
MRPLKTTALLLSLIVLPVFPKEKDLSPAQAALVATERAFARLAVEQGVRASFIAYFADDGIGFNPHPYKVKEVLSNRPAPARRSTIVLNWAPIFGGMARAGDLGWNTGPTVIEDTGPEKRPAQHGMFFSVWKKQSDGNWRVVLDLGNSTPAAVAPLNAPFRAAQQTFNKRPSGNNRVDVEKENAGLLEAEREFLAAARSGSVEQAYSSRLSDSARVHRPDVMPVVGKSALTAWLAGQTMTLGGEPIKVEVAGSGDLGYAYGSYELSGAKPEKGYYARVWARDAKGQWRIVMDVTTPIPPEQ